MVAGIAILLSFFCHAGTPLWTLASDPYYPPKVSITPAGTATIQYVFDIRTRKPILE